jgi:hypothetical protein
VPDPKYVPKHRSAPVKAARQTVVPTASPSTRPSAHRGSHRGDPTPFVRTGVRNAALVSGVAVAATGIAVSTGVLSKGGGIDGAAVALSASGHTAHLSDADLAAREQQASRSSDDRRAAADSLKEQALSNASGVARVRTADLTSADPQTLARTLMPQYGMSASEFDCLDNIWTQESGWNVHADNPSSSAYGIPQALPGSKMASAGPNWENNAETQIRWGLGYIKERYGSACSAWSFKAAHGWY